jgi:hypothetical protein
LVLQDSWGLGVGLTPPRKTIIVTKPSIKKGGQSPPRAVAPRRRRRRRNKKKKKKKKLWNEPTGGSRATYTSVDIAGSTFAENRFLLLIAYTSIFSEINILVCCIRV